jgi:hypothetical protein
MAEQKPAVLKAAPAILRYGLAFASVALGSLAAFLLDASTSGVCAAADQGGREAADDSGGGADLFP